MAVVGYFPATLAVTESGAQLRYAEAQVYAWADENYSTPLRITDLQGIAMPEGKLIAPNGAYPPFQVPAGITQVRAKSGSSVTPMTSLSVWAETAELAAQRALAAADQVDQIIESVEESRLAAMEYAERAEAVGATSDAQTAANIRNKTTQTYRDLSNTIDAVGKAQASTSVRGRLGSLRRFHRALGRRTFDAVDVLVIGDSITEGGSVTNAERRWVDRLRDNLRQRYPVAGVTGGRGFIAPRWGSASNPVPAPATFSGGTPASSDDFGWGKRAVALTTSQTITWTGIYGTSVDVLYARGSSSGTINVSVNGGAAVTASTGTGTTNDTGVLNVPLGAGANTIVVSATVATVYPGGIFVYNGDESRGIRVVESGHWGWRSQNWSELASTRRKYTMDRIERIVPDLVLIPIGINDHRNGVDPAATKTNVTSLIQAIRDRLAAPVFFPQNTGQATFVIVGYFESQGSFAYPWEQYAAVFREIAAASSDVSFLDLRDHLPSYNSDGYAWTVDGVHPSDETHGLIADAVAEFLAPTPLAFVTG